MLHSNHEDLKDDEHRDVPDDERRAEFADAIEGARQTVALAETLAEYMPPHVGRALRSFAREGANTIETGIAAWEDPPPTPAEAERYRRGLKQASRRGRRHFVRARS